jgi:hypothetical protein
MSKKHTFTAVIQNAGGGGAFVEVPFDVEAAFGSKKPKVKALIEGVPYRGLLVRTPALAPGASVGGPNHILIILKGIREQIGKTFADEIKVSVEADVEERVVAVPAELKRIFKSDKEAKAAFEKLSYTHQKEYVKWIDEAKKAETRQSRIVKTIEMLKQGRK